MNLSDYQRWIRERWQRQGINHPRPRVERLAIIALGLGGEAGEVQEHVKKHLRDGRKLIGNDEFLAELGDCLHYLTKLGQEFGYSLEDMATFNVAKLEKRHADKYGPFS